jgi:hypothetical protein
MKNHKTENFIFVYAPSCVSPYHSHILSVEKKSAVFAQALDIISEYSSAMCGLTA